jgi:serine/threonine protein kinase
MVLSLRKNERPIQQLVKYMVDVAMGMHYISERGLVHRDLAARNVLVGANEICKVADFGLLREIPRDDAFYTASHNVPCPIRWMAPESISDRQFSAASDVWSFGVLVWEMFHPTKLPFENYDNLACVSKVNEGLRLPIPRGSPSIVAKIMKACWHKNPNKRPSFLVISTLLSTKTTF